MNSLLLKLLQVESVTAGDSKIILYMIETADSVKDMFELHLILCFPHYFVHRD